MGMKLHRNRRVFRARKLLPRVLLWSVGAVAVVAVGFFGAKYAHEHPVGTAPQSTPNESSGISTPTNTPPESTDTPDGDTTPTPSFEQLRAFYLPFSTVKNTEALSVVLNDAQKAGFTGVVFDLKDENGTLYFRSETARAQQVNSFVSDALSADDTAALFAAIREAGLMPIPRLYAFKDNAAARALASARIAHKSDPSWVWYDADPANGGKAWLNPYADEAQLYILDLAKELSDAGAAAIMLDGVQFPTQTSSASFGSSANVNLGRDEILTAFIAKARTRLGNDCPVILSCSADAALGTNTTIYGNNPLTFTPTAAAPALLTGKMAGAFTVGSETIQNTPYNLKTTVQALVNQMNVRIKVIPTDKQPLLTPWLQAYDYTPAQIKNAMEGCVAGGADSFILYDPSGNYHFDALG
jgi:hypothetical protein